MRSQPFVSLEKHRAALVAREILERAYDLPLRGRADELAILRDFVVHSQWKVQLIHGPGGVGKSRLLYEAARMIYDERLVEVVYCGTPHLESSQDWYVDVKTTTKALVVIDEPQDPLFIERLIFELRGRLNSWRVIITARTPKDPIVAALQNPRDRVLAPPLELKPLNAADAALYSSALLAPIAITSKARPEIERWLVNTCGRFPIWMTVAAKMLESGIDIRNLPVDDSGIAKVYLRDILDDTRAEVGTEREILSLLRWISLTQPVNCREGRTLVFLGLVTEFKGASRIERAIEELLRRRVLSSSGSERQMVEVRPDVMRDYLLVEWLTLGEADSRRPSQASFELARMLADDVRSGSLSLISERITSMLGRMEYLIEPTILFLNPFVDATIKLAESSADATMCEQALSAARMFAPWRPRELSCVAKALRTGGQSTPSVLAALPRELYRAAHNCSTAEERWAVLAEFVAIVDLEHELSISSGVRSGGEDASKLLEKILHEYHGYRSSFRAEANALANGFLDKIVRGAPVAKSWQVVIEALSALERRDSYTHEDRPFTVTLESFCVSLMSEEGKIALVILERIWDLVASADTLPDAKELAWRVLDENHSALVRHRDISGWRDLLVRNLQRSSKIVSETGGTVSDLQAARRLWDWHLSFEKKDEELRAIAQACEAAYLCHPLMARYAPIFGVSTDELDQRVKDAARALSQTRPTAEALSLFFLDALQFTRSHAESWRTQNVRSFAWDVGNEIPKEEAVKEFVLLHSKSREGSSLFDVALSMARGALHALRVSHDDVSVATFLGNILSGADENAKREALRILFIYTMDVEARCFGLVDGHLLVQNESVVETLSVREQSILAGRLIRVDQALLESMRIRLIALSGAERHEAVGGLWEGYFQGLPYPVSAADLSPKCIDVLLTLSALYGDVGQSDSELERRMKKVFTHLPKKSVRWMVNIVQARLTAMTPSQGRMRAFPGAKSWLMGVVASVGKSAPSKDEQDALEELLAVVNVDASFSEEISSFVTGVDPYGQVVPALVAKRLANVEPSSGFGDVIKWARFAQSYPLGSPPWRVISLAACEHAAGLSPNDAADIFVALGSLGYPVRSNVLGELHPYWQEVVASVSHSLSIESSVALRSFWEWRLARASEQLEREKGRVQGLDA